ncbi:signal-induced proliferation-associated 1-like protein 1 isoform X3 [Acanthaster planci]|uniref:Signal-induced proliferation-associated 1-like protein 1 isoform X3 n=1 Tax=Acanthaster planci TaxID=133434 RepID=A0A8B7XKE7_ACAPL|nr:signal-induced proliferation-associated 1-like protein 1 isoform X3 [Acanthaster planci]
MAAQGRSSMYPAYMHNSSMPQSSAQSHLIKSVRQGAAQMAEYYHSTMVPNGRVSPPGGRDASDKFYSTGTSRSEGRRIPSMDDPLRNKEDSDRYTHSSSSSSGGLPSGQFLATPVKVEDKYDGNYEEVRGGSRLGQEGEVRPALAQESRTSTATRVQLTRNQDQIGTPSGSRGQFWREGLPDEKRTRATGSPHRRHNTSPDNKYFVSAQGHAEASRQAALTTDNVRSLARGDRVQLRRSNSNSTLNEITDRMEYHNNPLLPRREYGSTSSIDVQSVSGESFFQMLQDYRADVDQRSPAPPQLNRLLQGKVGSSVPLNDTERGISKQSTAAEKSASKELLTAKDSIDNADFGGSPRITRKQSKRNKKNRNKSTSGTDQSFFKKKLRSSMKGSDRAEALERTGRAAGEEDDITLEDRMEERTRQLAFQHYDVQSTYFDMQDAIRNRKATERKRNTTTGASAASRHSANNTPEGSLEDLLKVEQLADDGDGRGNLLIHSCPFFRNEIGNEVEPRVSFSRIGMLNARAMHREKHRAILEAEPEPERRASLNWKGPVIEFVDHGAMYYRKYFYGFEHQNYFGLDENYGPVAISIRRESRLDETDGATESKEKDKDAAGKYQYRIIVRTCELVTLRGVIAEDSIPSTAKHNSPKGFPLKDVLEYVVPDLPLACLRLALSSAKVTEQLLKLDEQGVSNKYKVGIMLCKAGQNTEEEMYNNEHSTPAFDEFLECIGERVRLKGFDKYRAQLDNKTDSTGTHSVYATYQKHEIMFHVSTMLPFTANNRQQLLRKRHIGNDIVTIVFQEPGAEPFTPKTIRSQFQHVFVVVRAIDPNTDNVFYTVAVTRSKDVSAFGPPLPANATFPKGPTFSEFLLAKIINAENVVHKSDKFIAMATRTRCEYLKDLAENSVTTTTVESGAKSSKFSLSHKKKEKACPRPAPDIQCKGALTWRVEVDEFSLSDPVECICAISPELFTLVREASKEVIFSIPCKAIIGWTDTHHNLKVYFNEGNCVRIRLPEYELDEIPGIVKRLEAVTSGVKTQEITLLRNGLGQLGFHVHYQGIVVEVDPYGWAWQAGLRKGARLVEICEIAVCTQSHDEMIDLLRTSQTVKVLVVPPHEDGSPRRGSTPIDYDASLPHTGKTPFNRSYSSGKAGHSYRAPITINRDGKASQGSHTRSATTPGTTLSAHGRTPSDLSRSSEDPDSIPSNAVRNAIATLERRIHHQPESRVGGQHRYRATVNYWKEVNQANRVGMAQREPGSLPSSGHGTLDSRSSRDGNEAMTTAFSRMAHDRRSAREIRTPRMHDMPERLRSSQEELEQISALAAVQQARLRNSQEELHRVATGGSHSRQSSTEDKLDHPHPRGRVLSDSSKSSWQHPARLPQSATFPESNRDRSNPQFATSNSHYRGASVKHSRSGDTLSSNNSDEKWYDTHDDMNGYHDSRLSRSRDNIAEPSYSTSTTAGISSHHVFPGEYRDSDAYGKPERYSPTEHLYPDRMSSDAEPQLQQQRTGGRPAPISSNVVLPAPSNSNLSDVSLHSHSTHSSGSSQRGGGEYRGAELGPRAHTGAGTFPRGPVAAHSPELSRRTTVHGNPVQGRADYVSSGHRRAGPSASSSSSISETSSPRISRRRTTEVRSSNDSLNTRLRQGQSGSKSLPANNELQENLRKLIAPESLNTDALSPSVTTLSGGGAHQAALPREHAQTNRLGLLHRTYSDESIAAGGGPYNRPGRHDQYDMDLSNDVLFTSAKSPQLESTPVPDNQQYKVVRFAAVQPIRTANKTKTKARKSSDDLNANNNRGTSNPSLFPLPDSAAHLDWHNLVETANAFQDTGLDHQSFKSASSNKLSDLRDGASPSHQPFHHSSGASVDRRKQLSQSTEALSPSASRRARPLLKTDYDTLKYASPTLDASAAKRSTQQLELELRRTQERLEMERKQKEELAGQVHKLLHDNKRLQGESASTAEQLQQFTDWFFNAIEK